MCDGALAPLVTFFLLFAAYKAFQGAWASSQDAKLLRENPEAWQARKELEEYRKHLKKQRFGQAARTGASVAWWWLRHR